MSRGGRYHPGRCKDCSQAAEPGRARCAPCAVAAAAREAVRRAARRAADRCVVCGGRAARAGGEALSLCPEHREYYRARSAASRGDE